MKTAMQELLDELKEANSGNNFIKTTINLIIDMVESKLETEKQQHEKTAIDITNIFMDALDNPKGGKFSGEEEFNKYWEREYGSTNKETLK